MDKEEAKEEKEPGHWRMLTDESVPQVIEGRLKGLGDANGCRYAFNSGGRTCNIGIPTCTESKSTDVRHCSRKGYVQSCNHARKEQPLSTIYGDTARGSNQRGTEYTV